MRVFETARLRPLSVVIVQNGTLDPSKVLGRAAHF